MFEVYEAIKKEGSTYQEIVNATGFSIEKVRFYLKILVKNDMITFATFKSSGMTVKQFNPEDVLYKKND